MIDEVIYKSPKRNRLYRRAPLAERFWPKVQKAADCWLWTGCRDRAGYGQLSGSGRGNPRIKAHRASWILHNGPIPAGLLVLHFCDNPQCVRPDHLWLGTAGDNSRDAAEKGRLIFQRHPERCPRGARASGAKLTVAQVTHIKELRAQGWTQCRLAETFGVSQQTVSYLLRGITWSSVATGAGEVRASEGLFG